MSSRDSGIEPNELAELYESFRIIDKFLEQLLESDPFDVHAPIHHIFSWKEAIHKLVKGDGWEDAPCYGEQQYNRNPISIHEYREEYGDGTKVTEFEAIDTVRLPSDQSDRLSELIDLDGRENLKIPIAPSSGEAIPLIVENETELKDALDLLSEFPEYPDVNGDVEGPDAKNSLQTVSEINEGQRLEELVVKVVAIDDKDRPKREVDLQVEDVSGESYPFTIWSKHSVSAAWSEATWYWLHESRVQVWDNSKGAKRNLSSTADIVVEKIGSNLDWDKINTYRQVYGISEDENSSVSGKSGNSSGREKGDDVDGSQKRRHPSTATDRVEKLLDDFNFG